MERHGPNVHSQVLLFDKIYPHMLVMLGVSGISVPVFFYTLIAQKAKDPLSQSSGPNAECLRPTGAISSALDLPYALIVFGSLLLLLTSEALKFVKIIFSSSDGTSSAFLSDREVWRTRTLVIATCFYSLMVFASSIIMQSDQDGDTSDRTRSVDPSEWLTTFLYVYGGQWVVVVPLLIFVSKSMDPLRQSMPVDEVVHGTAAAAGVMFALLSCSLCDDFRKHPIRAVVEKYIHNTPLNIYALRIVLSGVSAILMCRPVLATRRKAIADKLNLPVNHGQLSEQCAAVRTLIFDASSHRAGHSTLLCLLLPILSAVSLYSSARYILFGAAAYHVMALLSVLISMTEALDLFLAPRDYLLEAETSSNHSRREFLRGVFFDLRQPLNTIVMGINLMSTRFRGGSAGDSDAVELMQQSSKQMVEIMNDVLSIQNIDEGGHKVNYERGKVRSALKKMLGVFAEDLRKKNVILVVSVDDCVPRWLIIDRFRIEMVVSEIVSQLISRSDINDTTIRLSATLFDDKDGDMMLQFAVADTCTPLSEEEQWKLFASYSDLIHAGIGAPSLEANYRLSLCKEIVQNAGGEIYSETWSVAADDAGVSSEGNRVIFTFPARRCVESRSELSAKSGVRTIRKKSASEIARTVSTDSGSSGGTTVDRDRTYSGTDSEGEHQQHNGVFETYSADSSVVGIAALASPELLVQQFQGVNVLVVDGQCVPFFIIYCNMSRVS